MNNINHRNNNSSTNINDSTINSVKCKSPLLKELIERGFIKQCTDIGGLDEKLSNNNITGYVGFDCTASSFHVGNLMQIMLMRIFQKHGNTPVILLGGATTRIGDPSDKDEERKIIALDEIEKNKISLSKTFVKFLNVKNNTKNNINDDKVLKIEPIFVDNIDWFGSMKYLDFLRDYGRYFSINRMLTFESVKRRLDRQQPLTFLEFNYILLQSYDFIELNRLHNCILEFGGSEQWGNIVSGIELGRRVLNKDLFGITTPLITTSAGRKMGKTAQGAIWLNGDMLLPYDYWQFWRNVDDNDVIKFLKIYTDIPVEEIDNFKCINKDTENIDNKVLNGKDLNDMKILLANEVTKLCHGQEAAENAYATANKVFGQGGIGDQLPIISISEDDIAKGINFYKLFVIAKLCESGSTAKNLIQSGGAKIQDVVVMDPFEIITIDAFKISATIENARVVKLSAGKKKHCILKLM